MKYFLTLSIILCSMIILSLNDAHGQLAPNKSFTMTSNGFAVSEGQISESSSNMEFSIIKTNTEPKFDMQNGMIFLEQTDWTLSDLTGSLLQNGKLLKLNAQATDIQGKLGTFDATAKLLESGTNDSVYTISGTITDSQHKIIKLVYISKISQLSTKSINKPTENLQKSITVKILMGSANPKSETYKTQIAGFKFNFLSQDRIKIPPGGTITFVNEDNVTHSLVSGIDNTKQTKIWFIPDGKISSGPILPGKSWSVTYNDKGFFRLFDTKYKYIDATIFVYDTSKIQSTKRPLN